LDVCGVFVVIGFLPLAPGLWLLAKLFISKDFTHKKQVVNRNNLFLVRFFFALEAKNIDFYILLKPKLRDNK
jgi:hypothetical protein